MTLNAPSTRFPFNIAGKVDPEVENALRWAFNGLTNHEQAFAEFKAQLSTASSTSASAITTINETINSITVAAAANQYPGLGTVNDQSGNVSYTTTTEDNGALIVFSDASPVAALLTVNVTTPWFCFAQNWGAGVVTLTPESPATINSIGALAAASLTLNQGYLAMIVFDGTNFWAETLPVVPLGFASVAHEFLNSYNAVTGVFTADRPNPADVNAAYGDMYAYNLAGGASVITIAMVDTYYMVGAGLSGGAVNGFTFQNSRELKCGVAGTYLVTWSMSLHAAINNQEVEGAVMVNGAAQTATAAHTEIINSAKPATVAGSGILALAVNDLVQLGVLNHAGANNINLDHATLTVVQLA